MKEQIEAKVLVKPTAGAQLPTQGYEDDFAYDLYTLTDVLVPPGTYKSVKVSTGLKVAFDEKLFGMKINLRSGIGVNTPLIQSNGTGIIEGTYRNEVGLLFRNTFLTGGLVDFAYDLGGNKVPVKDIPKGALDAARKQFEEETEFLGYGVPAENSPLYNAFKTLVPLGTVFIRKNERAAQAHLAPKVHVDWETRSELPESVRGENGFGSSGTKKKG